jgi:ABC-2 type transport system permease protein
MSLLDLPGVKFVTNAISPMQFLKILMQADFRVLIKNRRSLIVSTVLPIFLLFVWNNKPVLSSFGGSLFVLALVTTIAIMSLSIFGYTLAIARDREKGVFQRLRVTPAPPWTIMVSRLLVQEIANLVIAIVVLIVGSYLYHVSLTIGDYTLVLLVSLLAGAVFLSIGQALVGLIKSADTVNAVARFTYIGLMLIGLLGLSGALGSTVKTIATWSPFGVVIRVYEGIPNLGVWDVHTSLALLACLGYIAVFGAIGVKWFRWDAR